MRVFGQGLTWQNPAKSAHFSPVHLYLRKRLTESEGVADTTSPWKELRSAAATRPAGGYDGRQSFLRSPRWPAFPRGLELGSARMKKLPIGIQNFDEIATGDYIYVDKTEYLHKLLVEGKAYFLSRPRRFGKSLLISTLENLFLGRKELFEGLWIRDRWEFEKHPVVRIDLVAVDRKNAAVLEQGLLEKVREIGTRYGVKVEGKHIAGAFYELIRKLSAHGRVVVLIDEYDKPIIDFVTRPEIAKENREVLKNFYGILKAADEYLKFVLLTGVSKFTRTSIFSDLNNLYDVTMDKAFSNMLGYTEEEVDAYFEGHMEEVAKDLGEDTNFVREKMKHWYSGYRFSERDEKVYNPFSVLNFLKHKRFDNYWFQSGTPTFLVELMRERNYDVSHLETLIMTSDMFSKFDVERIEVEPLLFQTGYLTITGAFQRAGRWFYELGYPNAEVEESLLNCLLDGYTGGEWDRQQKFVLEMSDLLNAGQMDEFLERLKVLWSGVPYEIVINKEDYYNSLMYMSLKMIGLEGAFEVMTNRGRLDCALELKDRVYIFEFKIDEAPQKCIEQIRERGYHEKYRDRGKPIELVGVTYSSEEKNITGWTVERA
ncbi:MAG: AAA family ATPase [Candidatus Hydrogenedentota bacterium]|nr:MAG: AAA family ATPase [Candidatus Hydrogenedentota bacterium]